jgi:hypothetical protein
MTNPSDFPPYAPVADDGRPNPFDAPIPADHVPFAPRSHTREWYIDQAMTWIEQARRSAGYENTSEVHAYAALAQVYATLALENTQALATNLIDG